MANFEMICAPSYKTFVIQLTNASKIAEARNILAGSEHGNTHVMGKIVKKPQSYNPGWSFHLDPDTISFFQVAIEVCDASPEYVEDHLDEACGAFLPGCMWCPWSSRLTREIA